MKKTCESVGMNVCVCSDQGPRLLKVAVPQINIQEPTKLSKEEQGVMGNAEKTISWVQMWKKERRKVRRREYHRKQHERKINGRCLRGFSVALAKTGNGFMRRRRKRRNSTFLGKTYSQGYME